MLHNALVLISINLAVRNRIYFVLSTVLPRKLRLFNIIEVLLPLETLWLTKSGRCNLESGLDIAIPSLVRDRCGPIIFGICLKQNVLSHRRSSNTGGLDMFRLVKWLLFGLHLLHVIHRGRTLSFVTGIT